ncbi:MAG: phage holin family protein [Acidobacteria bacterium]|nr:phage holin family protein [Acidobacteriota bacterium]
MQKAKEERSLGDLFSELSKETSTLMRQEVTLAQVELTQKATIVGKQVGSLVVGGAVGYAAVLILLVALVIAFTQLISSIFGWTTMTSAWVAAAIIGLVVGGVAFSLITSALATLKKTDLTPQQTIESLKEDAQWIKNQVS